MKSLLFSLADRPFALPAEMVAEVVRPTELTAVPGPPWLAGALRQRDFAIWVVRLAAFLGLKQGGSTRDDHVVIVQSREGGPRRGLLVQRVQGVEQLTLVEVSVPAALAAAPAGAYIQGIMPYAGRPLYLLAVDRLLAAGVLRDLGDSPPLGSFPP